MIDDTEPTGALAPLVVGLLDRVDEFDDAMAERITAEANVSGECAVPMDDLRSSSRAELRDVLDALGGLAPLDTAIGAETGRRRARLNVPEVTLLAGYRVDPIRLGTGAGAGGLRRPGRPQGLGRGGGADAVDESLGPPAGRPERLVPDLPPSPAEAELWAQLRRRR